MPSKYNITYETEEDIDAHIQKKLALLDKQIDKCDKQALVTAVALQGDLSYYLYEKHIPQEQYFEYKSQLSSAVKQFMKCNCKTLFQ